VWHRILAKKLFLAFFILTAGAGLVFGKSYERIVSLAPDATNALYELGLDEQVKAITIYCPKGASPKEIIGSVLVQDIEKIIALKPDIVVASKDGNDKRVVERLRQFGINVFVLEQADSFEAICDNFTNLANALDRKKEARQILDYVNKGVLAIRRKNESKPPQTVFWEVADNPLYSCGKRSYLNSYNYFTNTKNIYADIDINYFAVEREDVLVRNPQTIIVLSMAGFGDRKTWQKFKHIEAVKNNRIFVLSSSDMLGATPLKFLRGLEILDEALHQ
jgi:ABC-type Fe3+-hydroxamate transport system substrate-binding protein